MRLFATALRFIVVFLIAVLLIPFLLVIALWNPELFFKKEEKENIHRRVQQARQWVVGKSIDASQ
jgi:hypothetical protein